MVPCAIQLPLIDFAYPGRRNGIKRRFFRPLVERFARTLRPRCRRKRLSRTRIVPPCPASFRVPLGRERLFGEFEKLGLSPALAASRDLALRFGTLVRARSADALTPWLADAENSELRGFAAGLRQDEQAVRAALTLPWSSGQVEGQVTRLKLVKRQGYGRAKLDLLRARLVRAA